MNAIVTRGRTNGSLTGFDRLWDEMLGSVWGGQPRTEMRRPAVDVRELEDRYELTAELPGMAEDQVDIQVDGRLLTIGAKRNEEANESERKGYILRERRSFEFRRSFSLPEDVDRDRIEAKFENGLLVLALHKAESAKPRRIEISRN